MKRKWKLKRENKIKFLAKREKKNSKTKSIPKNKIWITTASTIKLLTRGKKIKKDT